MNPSRVLPTSRVVLVYQPGYHEPQKLVIQWTNHKLTNAFSEHINYSALQRFPALKEAAIEPYKITII